MGAGAFHVLRRSIGLIADLVGKSTQFPPLLVGFTERLAQSEGLFRATAAQKRVLERLGEELYECEGAEGEWEKHWREIERVGFAVFDVALAGVFKRTHAHTPTPALTEKRLVRVQKWERERDGYENQNNSSHDKKTLSELIKTWEERGELLLDGDSGSG
ncbi:hypothetical protein B484DRAFT_426198, partial [Ochromonadaceae sp. CCMP2298]